MSEMKCRMVLASNSGYRISRSVTYFGMDF